MKRKTWGGFLSLALVGAMLVAGCGPTVQQETPGGGATSGPATSGPETGGAAGGNPAPAAEDIIIGMAIDMSAGTASYGAAAQQAGQMAIDEFNEAGGYQGRKAKLIIYDDAANPQKSQELTSRLISQDKAVALIGPANSGNANQHIETVQRAEIPEVIPVATAAPITLKYQGEPKNYIFRVSMVDSAQVAVMLRHAKEKGFKKIGVVHDTTGYGQFGVEEVRKQAPTFGVEIAAEASFQVGDPNVEPQLNKMRDANVDMVIIYALAPEVAQVLKSADKINYAPTFMGTWASGDPLLKQLVGDMVNKGNLFMVQSFTVDQSPAAIEFDKKMQARYGDKYIFPIAAAQTYDSVNLILQAIKKVGTDPKAIRDAIENIDDFKAVTAAPAKPFTKENHEAIGADVMFVGTWKDGRVVKAQ
jgi:branched-chain amino acid transport system substrate-binding protein